MANYQLAYEILLKNEGGYVNDPDDPGGETYRGISRKNWPNWEGWKFVDNMKARKTIAFIDADAISLEESVKRFYKVNFWDKVCGDQIVNQDIATSIFDFAVNTGIKTASQLAQKVVGTNPDGMIGFATLSAINQFSPDHFISSYAVEKIKRYIQIVTDRPSSRKYFFGWVVRSVHHY